MTGWIILAAILLLLVLIAVMRCRVIIEYNDNNADNNNTDNNNVKVVLGAAFFRYNLYPGKEKEIKLSDFTPKKLRRKDIHKKKAEAVMKAVKPNFKNVTELLSLVRDIISELFKDITGYLKTEVVRFRLKIAAGDAAETALVYAAAVQGAAYLFEILDKNSNMKIKKNDSVSIVPDFCGEKFTADIKIVFLLRFWQLAAAVIPAVIKYVQYNNKASADGGKTNG